MIIKVRSASYHLDKMCFCSILLRHYYHYVLRLETFKARLYLRVHIHKEKERRLFFSLYLLVQRGHGTKKMSSKKAFLSTSI